MNDVSVIIPTWNRAEAIEKAVRSALEQTVPPLEVLVCDDGSTDNTYYIVGSINDPRVKWIDGVRGGRPAIPRNRGIRESKGEWFAFLDSDDEWFANKLEKQLTVAEELNCLAVCSNSLRLIPEKGSQGSLLLYDKDRICFDDLLEVNQVICSSSLVHRSIFDQVLGFPEDACLTAIEDYALWLRVVSQTDFAYVKEPLLVYRDDPGNSIRNPDTSTVWMQRKFVLSNFLDWSEKRKISTDYMTNVIKEYKKSSRLARRQKCFSFLKKLVP